MAVNSAIDAPVVLDVALWHCSKISDSWANVRRSGRMPAFRQNAINDSTASTSAASLGMLPTRFGPFCDRIRASNGTSSVSNMRSSVFSCFPNMMTEARSQTSTNCSNPIDAPRRPDTWHHIVRIQSSPAVARPYLLECNVDERPAPRAI
ncbi:hypothetical protein PBRA_009263 [Plasmodiophora brassicae]|uniref:Uncharacterized protein n=1 Tax=Plasmodiophora brassicae TaxID=37360 RepID=A0A0G4J642_PLABS|nr:hypothetical protein PBRA_009263 [Plasmodiophora brassicae]